VQINTHTNTRTVLLILACESFLVRMDMYLLFLCVRDEFPAEKMFVARVEMNVTF
jgi:hypothetical protein